MACKITSGLGSSCAYGVGGNTDIWLANWEDILSWTDTDSPADGVLDKVTFKNTTTITGVTNANPGVVTAAGHGFNSGDIVVIVGISPMDGLVGTHTVGTIVDANNFELEGYDSTALSAFAGSSVTVQPGGFYQFVPVEGTLSTNSEETRGNGNIYFTQTITFQMGANALNQTMKDNLDNMGLGRFVAIVRNKSGSYKIFGQTNGLTANITDSHGAGDGDFGGYTVTMNGVEVFNPNYWDNATNGLPVVEEA
jgi:hypothetical protein